RHYGMSAYYAMLALPHDMIGIAMTNASRQVVPTFGREARFGTNPMCYSVPADQELPFVLDMATTTAAAGKLELAARQGKSIPAGWALNEQAEATLDPRMAQKARRLLPLGGSRRRQSQRIWACDSRGNSLRRIDRNDDSAQCRSRSARAFFWRDSRRYVSAGR